MSRRDISKEIIKIFDGTISSADWDSPIVSLGDTDGHVVQIDGALAGTGTLEYSANGTSFEPDPDSVVSWSGTSFVYDVVQSSCAYVKLNVTGMNGVPVVITVNKKVINGVS